jgi:succinyl-CoA synthetase beta subunit
MDIGKPVAIKAQVLAGGRGKAGGIRFAESPEQAGSVTGDLLGRTIQGEAVEMVLVEERVDIDRELYLGITVDGSAGAPLLMVSLDGGIDIEERAAQRPERIRAIHWDLFQGLKPHEIRKMVKDLGIFGEIGVKVAESVYKLCQLFLKYDALIAEINPLVITHGKKVVAADGVIEIDDSALFRHPEFQGLKMAHISDPLAREGQAIGVSYVGLDGDIGLICSGAGLGMASVDLISRWGRPANFLETGGGITAELMAGALRLVLKKPGLKGIFINLYGGINPIHQGAEGLARVIREDGLTLPIVAKALGNFQEETWRILEEAGVTVVKTIDTEGAVEALFKKVRP